MAEATTADVLAVQEKTLKKVTVIGNILNKNMIPKSQQKERDKEANAWKKRLFGFLSGIKDSLGNLAKGALKVAGKFPWAILLLLLKFLKEFMGPLKAALNALKGVAAWLRGLPLMIKALTDGLKGARALVLDKIAKALKAFKEGPLMRRIAGIFNTIGRFIRNALGLAARGARGARAVGGVLGALAVGLKTFLSGPLIRRLKGIFNTIGRFIRNALGLAARGARGARFVGGVLGALSKGLATFLKGSLLTRIGNIFNTISRIFRQAFGFARGGGRAVGGIIGTLRTAAATFKTGTFMTRLANIFKTIGGIFSRAIGIARPGRALAAAGGIIGAIALAAKNFKTSMFMTRVAGIFGSIGRIIGNAIGIAGRGARGTIAAGSFLAKFTVAAAGFLKSPVVTGIKGLFSAITGALSGVVTALRGTGTAIGAGARAGGAAVAGVGRFAIGILGGLRQVVSTIGKFSGLTKLMAWTAKFTMATVGRLFWPITALFGIFGFIDGYRKEKNWEGEPATLKDKILMGIEGAVDQMIMIPLNMMKDMTGWLLDKMGAGLRGTGEFDPEGEEIMEKAGWRKAMDDFDFKELWHSIFRGFVDIVEGTMEWFKTLFTDPATAMAQVWEGSKDVGKWLYEHTIKGLVDWLVGFWPSDWGALVQQGFAKIPGGTALYNMITGANRAAEIEEELTELRAKRLTTAGRETQEERTGWNLGSALDKVTNQYTPDEQKEDLREIDADILKLLEEQKTLNTAALKEKSIFTHDVNLEKLLAPLPIQMGALLRAYGATGGGGTTTVNNVTVAPQTSTSVASTNISENVYGTVDPYTNAAGAYG